MCYTYFNVFIYYGLKKYLLAVTMANSNEVFSAAHIGEVSFSSFLDLNS